MWLWKTLVFAVLLYRHTSSQPISDDSAHDRTTRQLDFEECCPCFDKNNGDHEDGFEELLAAGTEGVMRPRAGDQGDCPCRCRDSDSKGASSVFFPTAMRAAGSFLSPGEKKEDLKPLFNPEVDLASSVLQTLREVTDEEYQDALARDAAKSAARAAEEDIVLGDAIPQESANIVTIVVNPSGSFTEDDDVIPQASHIQQSRCIHPLQTTRPYFSKMRVATKPSSILHKSKLPKSRPGLLHRNLYHVDSGMGASNVHEHIIPFDDNNPESRTDTSPLRLLESTHVHNPSSNNDVDGDSKLSQAPDFRLNSLQSKLKDFDINRSPLLRSIRDKTIKSLSSVPKLKFGSLLPEQARNENEDLSPAPSSIHEQAATKAFRTNLPLGGFKQKSRPLSITNLLNLRDVELVPLKDLVDKKVASNKMNKSKFILPSTFSRDDDKISTNEVNVDTENGKNGLAIIMRYNAVEDNTNDLEGGPNHVNNQVRSIDEQIGNDDCEEVITELKPDTNADEDVRKLISTEVLDKLPGSVDELPKGALSTEDTECMSENNNQDSITDASNNINDTIESQDTGTDNRQNSSEDSKVVRDESCDQDEQSNDSYKTLDKKPKLKLLDHVSVDKTISTIKENIAKKLEDLKNMKINMKNKNLLNQDTVNEDRENKDIASDENQDSDCENETSMQITTLAPNISDVSSENMITTAKPESEGSEDTARLLTADVLNEDVNNASDYSDKEVSLQDLQRLSDSMLQKEEREREAKVEKSHEPSEEVTVDPLTNNSKDNDWLDSDKSADTRREIAVEPESFAGIQRKNSEPGACRSDLASPKTSLSHTDASSAASDILINTISKESDFLGTQRILQPALNLFDKPLLHISDALKLPSLASLPALDEITEKITDVFDENVKNLEDFAAPENKDIGQALPDTQDASNPVMATGASTSSFQSRKPPTKFLEDVNFDFFDLKPTSNIPSNIPKLGLSSYKTKIPLPKELSLKPITSQSALEDKLGLLGAKLSIGENNNHPNIEKSHFQTNNKPFNIIKDPLEMRPRLDEIKDHVLDSPLEATNHIYSTLKNTHRALESRLRQATNDNFNILKSPIRGSPSLLETLSRNHEDINDKLQGLHMDLNDRLETMHNELMDRTKLLTSGSHNIKPNFRSSSIFNKQKKTKQPLKHTWQLSNRRESQKLTTPRKPVKISPPLKAKSQNEQKKFRMPTAASVPVPKTVQVPELKKAFAKSTPLTLQQGSSIVRNSNAAAPRTKGILDDSGRQSTSLQNHNKLLRTEFKPLKDSKIKVSFSTTPRSPIVTEHKFRNSSPSLRSSNIGSKSQETFGSRMLYRDHDESPSEVKKSLISAPVSDHLNRNKYTNINMDRELTSRRLAESEEDSLQTSERGKHSNKSAFNSWPEANESSFLTKVREAVKTRLAKVNSAKTLKQPSFESDKVLAEKQSPEFNLDMARSATEIKEIVDEQTLKENVSYKCEMVCTKDPLNS